MRRRRPHDHRRASAEATGKVPFDLQPLMTKKEISKMIDVVYRHCGQKETVIFCRPHHGLGFRHACKAGISFGKDDMVIPIPRRARRRDPTRWSRNTSSSTMTA
jgi:hypothetical protein